ncbi:amidohydrolase, imidazolonepropionase [Idiomarina sp. A28L]|uniref:amidohydrolase family protein n=1 Tax=Idiomarina sp. A28L TaxID=1036674 RepID=UPI0002138BC7|nr:amidohydrolase family protein [Idiomarina sp. A28L]EGN74335.1 amidohydrolase, imidazolonepropionase [Idiomarina sp. A28L]
MKKLILSLAIGLAISSAAIANNVVPGSNQSQPVLLQGGTVHTVSNGVLEGADIIFADGKIIEIGMNLSAPEGARVLNISGQHVYPGFIALDTTLGLVEMGAVRATVDTNEVGNFTPEVQAHHAFNADSDVTPTIRYTGITHAQIVPQGSLVRGQSSLLKLDSWNWQDGLEQGDLGIHLTWPRVGLNNAWWERRSAAEQQKAQSEQRSELSDIMETAKVYHEARDRGVQTRIDRRWEAMRGLFTKEKKLFVHADDRRQIEQALAFNERHGFDLVIMGGRDSWMVADKLAAANVPVVFGSAYGLPARVDEAYDTAFTTPARLAEAGVEFAIAYPGFWDVRNLAFAAGNAVAFGLDYDQAVASITYGPAKIMGVEDRLGTIDVGKQATLVVSTGDALDQLGQEINFMFIDGREVNLSNKQKQLYEKYQQRIVTD